MRADSVCSIPQTLQSTFINPGHFILENQQTLVIFFFTSA